jgi:hypothetical protein
MPKTENWQKKCVAGPDAFILAERHKPPYQSLFNFTFSAAGDIWYLPMTYLASNSKN